MPREEKRVGSGQLAVGNFLKVKIVCIGFRICWGSGITPTYIE